MYWESWFTEKLNKRKERGLLRELPGDHEGMIDFASNDYLGLARLKLNAEYPSGSTGSRLLTGDSGQHHETEEFLAKYFDGQSALLFNSGYQGNLSILSALPKRGDTILYDELSHASIKDGLRLSQATYYSFRHNDLNDLSNKIEKSSGNIFIVVEGIYSMDGDEAPLGEILEIAKNHNAGVIIDEAHSGGIVGERGRGLSYKFRDHPAMLVRLYTFGKAFGSHGACFIGNSIVKDFLVNFARPFIYTTSLPAHSLAQIRYNLNYLDQNPDLINKLKRVISYFKEGFTQSNLQFLNSNSPIQGIIIPGNEMARELAGKLQFNGLDVRPILSPTVPVGKERLRICLHHYNTESEIDKLSSSLKK